MDLPLGSSKGHLKTPKGSGCTSATELWRFFSELCGQSNTEFWALNFKMSSFLLDCSPGNAAAVTPAVISSPGDWKSKAAEHRDAKSCCIPSAQHLLQSLPHVLAVLWIRNFPMDLFLWHQSGHYLSASYAFTAFICATSLCAEVILFSPPKPGIKDQKSPPQLAEVSEVWAYFQSIYHSLVPHKQRAAGRSCSWGRGGGEDRGKCRLSAFPQSQQQKLQRTILNELPFLQFLGETNSPNPSVF